MSKIGSGSTNGGTGERRKEAVQSPLRLSKSLQHALAILQLFSAEHKELGIAEMADLVELSRPTTHRYARSLVRFGVMEQGRLRKYRLAARAADSGLSLLGAMRKTLPVQSVLEDLRSLTGYTVSLGVLDGTHVTYLQRLYAHRIGQYHVDQNMGVGTHIPIHCTALGKALLSGLTSLARRKLVARVDFLPYGPNSIMEPRELLAELECLDYREPIVSDEEFLPGVRSIAMYVRRPAGEPRIAIDITIPASAVTAERLLERFGPPLRSAVKLLSQAGQS